jgi:hypothetical protein
MSSEATFLDLYLAGKVQPDEIDDFVDRWHETPAGRELHDYLGMTPDEYSLWLRAPDALPYIAKARREMRPLTEIVAGKCRELRRGARAVAGPNIARLEDWLKAKGEVI